MSEIDYYIGVDLGQSQDYTAVTVLEAPVWVPPAPAPQHDPKAMWPGDRHGWISPSTLGSGQLQYFRSLNYHEGRPAKPPLAVSHLERFPLHTKYPVIVDRVKQIMASPPIANGSRALLVDATGVGRAVVDMFEAAGLRPMAITITGGTTVNREEDGSGFRVPQRDLISATVVLVETRRLSIADQLPEAKTLQKELLAFQRRITAKSAQETYAAERQEHDDLLFSLAMCCWYREWWNHNLDLANEPKPAGRVGWR